VQDVADLILLSLKHNLQANKPAGFQRFYLSAHRHLAVPEDLLTGRSAENGEHEKLAFAKKLAKHLRARGLVKSEDILHVPAGDVRAPHWANNTTSRCHANRSRKELGWQPKHEMGDQEIEQDVADILKAMGK
jgi:hypothetical protein